MIQKFRGSRHLFIIAAIALVIAGAILLNCGDNQPVATNASSGVLARNANDIQAVMDIQNRHNTELTAIDGVLGTGITMAADGKYALMVFTETADVAGIPASVDGLPTITEPSGRRKSAS